MEQTLRQAPLHPSHGSRQRRGCKNTRRVVSIVQRAVSPKEHTTKITLSLLLARSNDKDTGQ